MLQERKKQTNRALSLSAYGIENGQNSAEAAAADQCSNADNPAVLAVSFGAKLLTISGAFVEPSRAFRLFGCVVSL